MNQLPIKTRAQIINLLVEGNSLRATSRLTGCSINTVTKLLVDVAKACERFHYETVKGIKSRRVQCDEIWSFVYSKQKNVPVGMEAVAGSVWTWVGMDAESKLIISWFVGDRTAESANLLMQDIAKRVSNRIQLTTDGHSAYLDAVDDAFEGMIDYAQLVKLYGNDNLEQRDKDKTEKRYSPPECIGTRKMTISGRPDEKHISTSYIERQNLTMRMHMRRFTRLTNAFSKKLDNHCYAVALHTVFYNFVRIHKSLRVTPAMEAGLTKKLWNVEDIVRLIESS